MTAVVGDITTESGRAALLAACPSPDILVNNNAGPPPAEFAALDYARWMSALESNLVAPLLLVRAVLPGMIARRFGRIVNITSAMVTTPRPHMMLSSAARAGLTAALKGLSLDVARHNVTINNLLPERFDTDRQEQMAQRVMRQEGIDYQEARARRRALPRGPGDPAEFGASCAFYAASVAASSPVKTCTWMAAPIRR